MEQLVQELQEKLRKSEASRVKLRDSLRQLKERAVDTSELVRQHQQLQFEVSQKAQEAEEHRLAREALQRELEAATQGAASPPSERDGDLARRLQARLERAQQTAADASAAARKSEHECANLQKQSASLRERIKEVEHKQKASVGDVVHFKEQLGKQAAALQCMSQQLSSVSQQQAACASRQETVSLAQQVARLEELASASMVACEAARTDRDRMRQRLEVMQAEASVSQAQQQAALQQLSRWQAAFGAFAREVGSSPRSRRTGGEAIGPARIPAADGTFSGDADDGLQLVPYSSNDSASSGSRSSGPARQAANARHAVGEAVPLQEPVAQAAHTSTGTVAGPGEGAHMHRDRAAAREADMPAAKRQRLDTAGSGGNEGSNAVRTPTGTVLTPRQHHERAGADAQRATDARPGWAGGPAPDRQTPEADGGSAASGTAATKAWKNESAAVSIVEDWLGEVTGCVERPVSDTLVQGAAAGLRDALAAGQCPLSCVVAGFETALLECAAARGLGCSLPDDSAQLGAPSGSAGTSEEIPFSAVWCRRDVLQSGSFTGLLACARALGRLLAQARAWQQEGFMEALLQRLHGAAVRPPPGLHTALHTPACSAAAACAALYRAHGNVQAMRVLVFDLATAEAELTPRMLPRLAAAVLAWPAALSSSTCLLTGVLGPALLAALHDISRTALQEQGRAADDTATAAGSVSGTTSAAELLPGVSAAAAALLAVCEGGGVARAKSVAQGHERWPVSLAALRALLRRGAAMAGAAAQPDAWHEVGCALQVATACLGRARCREEAVAIGACSPVAANLEASQKLKLGWL